MWQAARDEAREPTGDRLEFPLIGYDVDDSVLSLARYHARQAGVDTDIHFQQQPFAELTTKRKFGCIICNPPYGERIGDREQSELLYREMGEVLSRLDTWSFYVLSPHSDFERLFGRRADRRRKLYNGRIECTYQQYHGPRPPRISPKQPVEK